LRAHGSCFILVYRAAIRASAFIWNVPQGTVCWGHRLTKNYDHVYNDNNEKLFKSILVMMTTNNFTRYFL